MIQAKSQEKTTLDHHSDTKGDLEKIEAVSPNSKELVIGLVGYAGAGCSDIGNKLWTILDDAGYKVEYIKLSELIEKRAAPGTIPQRKEGPDRGKAALARAVALQDAGDRLRHDYGAHAVASLAIRDIKSRRGKELHGDQKIAFVLDSIKHDIEVSLLRQVYDKSFRLIAVHCDRPHREKRLIGKRTVENAKFAGADEAKVKNFMDRDERDEKLDHGQQVRNAFYLADFFLNNNTTTQDGLRYIDDLKRFVDLLLGNELVRPSPQEVGMFHAQSAAWHSSCLSRQVGAALQAVDGTIIATGSNEVPKFGGGVYSQGDKPDSRCFVWEKEFDGKAFRGCHNARRKALLRQKIIGWLSQTFSEKIAEAIIPPKLDEHSTVAASRAAMKETISGVFQGSTEMIERMPGIRDLIEFSRSIHAEMNTLLSAARQGSSPVKATLYCTTFPCHNCARHLVTAGLKAVYYIEPYVKSLAAELHDDSIRTELDAEPSHPVETTKLLILPFTGIGPKMYEDFFVSRGKLKDDKTGVFIPPKEGAPAYAVRLRDLANVENAAASLMEDPAND